MSSTNSSKSSNNVNGKGKAKDDALTFEQAYEALKNSNPEELDEHHLTLWRRIQPPAADQDNEHNLEAENTDGTKTSHVKDAATAQMNELSKAITFNSLSHEQLDEIIYMSLSAKRGATGLPVNGESSAASGSVAATPSKHVAPVSGSFKDGGGHTSTSSSGSSGFVRGSNSRDADPFASTPTRSGPNSNGNWRSRDSGKTSSSSSSHRASASNNWRNGHANNAKTIATALDSNSSPDSSSSRGPVTNRNAQAYFLPSSCLFVANLYSPSQDVDLEHDVTMAFKGYGTVFVKIRRDPKGMPYAFVQFTNDLSADRAFREVSGQKIAGRSCRVERARANRDFLLARRDGGALTVSAARPIVEGFGPIENIWIPSVREMSLWGVTNVVVVRYQFYENGRAAVPAMQDHDVYRMFAHPDTHHATRRSSMQSSRTPPSNPHSRFLTIYETDRRSIFVGDLTDTITEPVLRQHFGVFGMILGVSIHRQDSIREEGTLNVFAFIEFEDAISAFDAIRVMNNTAFQGMNLRVMQKNSEHSSNKVAPRRAQRHSSSMSRPSRPFHPQQYTEMQAPQMATPSHQMPAFQGPPNPHWAQTPATPMSNTSGFNPMYGAYANHSPPIYYGPQQYWGVESPVNSQGYYQHSPVYHHPGAYDPNYYNGIPPMGAFTAPPPCYPGHYAAPQGPVPYNQPHYEPYAQLGGYSSQPVPPASLPTYVEEAAGAAASAAHIVSTIVAQNAAAKAAKIDAEIAAAVDVEVDDTANTDTDVDASTDAATDSATDSGVALDADEDTLVYEHGKM